MCAWLARSRAEDWLSLQLGGLGAETGVRTFGGGGEVGLVRRNVTFSRDSAGGFLDWGGPGWGDW